MTTDVSRHDLVVTARKHLVPGVTREQAVILGYAELVGQPLDPWSFDDAAVLLRAEALVLEGLSVVDAMGVAKQELATWS